MQRNPNIRKATIDALKFAIRSPISGKYVRERRKGIDSEIPSIASKLYF